MSSFLSELGGITAGVGAEGLAFAAGFAAAHALEPEAVTIRQDAWNGARVLRIPPELAAQIAAENIGTFDNMQNEAHYYGWDDTRFPYLYHLNLVAPGMGELLTMLRRGTINSGNFSHGLRKNKFEPMWDDALAELAVNYIGLGDIAYAIVRGILPAPSYVPVPPPTSGTSVPRYPQVNVDPEALAAKLGYSAEQLEIMVGRSGLSMAPIMAANALFRGLINEKDYELAIAEGDLRTEWAPYVRDAARAILTPGEAMEGSLRGWWSLDEGKALAALHGMTAENAQRRYEINRRPLPVATITKALARGGTFDTTQAPFDDPYVASVHEANLGPEWYGLGEAMKYSYPSAFVVRALLKDGAISQTEGENIFLYEGYPPALAAKVAAAYAPAAGSAADPHVTKAMNTLYTTTHKSYVGQMIDPATATTALGAAGVTAAAVPAVLNIWNEERSLIRKQLTPAQVAKAIKTGAINPATGVAWTMADGMNALLERGYDQDDATTLLEESA